MTVLRKVKAGHHLLFSYALIGFYHLVVTTKKWQSLGQVTVISQVTSFPNDLDHLLVTCQVSSFLLVFSLIEVTVISQVTSILMTDHLLVTCQVTSLSLGVTVISSIDDQMVRTNILFHCWHFVYKMASTIWSSLLRSNRLLPSPRHLKNWWSLQMTVT